MSLQARHSLGGVNFEWDHAKATANVAKHGVTSELACEVFFIVYAVRHEEIIRIISARHATPAERRLY